MGRLWKILSIDGGGIRGLIPAEILRAIESKTEKSVTASFDVFAGTSTGGLIALALTSPKSTVKSAEKLVQLYTERGTSIFPPSYFEDVVLGRRSNLIASIQHVIFSKYRAKGLENVLDEILGDSMLGDATHEVLVTSYDITGDRSFVFSRNAARASDEFNCEMALAARATSAAPTYFDPLTYRKGTAKQRLLIDGGLYANNPAYVILRHVVDELAGSDDTFLLLSIGTGTQYTRMLQRDVSLGGQWFWRKDALRIVFKNSMVLAADSARSWTQSLNGQYFRWQIDIPTSLSESMDDTRTVNLQALRKLTDKITGSSEFDILCKLIT